MSHFPAIKLSCDPAIFLSYAPLSEYHGTCYLNFMLMVSEYNATCYLNVWPCSLSIINSLSPNLVLTLPPTMLLGLQLRGNMRQHQTIGEPSEKKRFKLLKKYIILCKSIYRVIIITCPKSVGL